MASRRPARNIVTKVNYKDEDDENSAEEQFEDTGTKKSASRRSVRNDKTNNLSVVIPMMSVNEGELSNEDTAEDEKEVQKGKKRKGMKGNSGSSSKKKKPVKGKRSRGAEEEVEENEEEEQASTQPGAGASTSVESDSEGVDDTAVSGSSEVTKMSNKKGGKDDGPSSNENFEVARIIDMKYSKKNKRVFLIRWKNYSAKYDSWVAEEDLRCEDLLKGFMKKVDEAKSIPPRELRANRKITERFGLPMYANKRRLSKRTASAAPRSYKEYFAV